jgi:putative NADH-flavin reductase
MKIEIEHEGSCLGATGGIGRLIVRDAPANGHSVVAKASPLSSTS